MTFRFSRRVGLGAACLIGVAGTVALVPSAAFSTSHAQKPLAGMRIGYANCCPGSTTNAQLNAMRREMKLFNEGEKLQVVLANLDAAKQLSQVTSFIGQKFDAVMTTTFNGAGYDALAKQAKKQGVVFTNLSGSLVNGADFNVNLANYQSAYVAGVAAAKWLQKYFDGKGEGGVSTIPNSVPGQQRTDGYIAGIHSVLPGLKVWVQVDQKPTALEQGSSALAALLQAHPDIKMLFGATELFSVGMVQAAKERGITDPHKLHISAPDGTPGACFDQIKKGTPFQMCGTVSFPQASAIWMRMTELKLKGVTIPKTGVVNPTAVTSANVDRVLAEQADPLNLKYRKDLLSSVRLFAAGTNVWTANRTPTAKTPSLEKQFWAKYPWPKRSA